MTTYRADVDGLRAVAIIVVVAYHVGVPGVGGGFTGVDVFFVLSGYLITGILWTELRATGRIDWRVFYARRARRLLPALAVTALLTLGVGMLVLPPDPDLRWLSQSLIGTAGFVSNIFFWLKTGGYFGATADTLPLLHTWSLAVEEQFYLVWPVLLLVAWRMWSRGGAARRLTIGFLALLVFASFGFASLVSDRSAAFYLMPSRLWELGAGAIVAMAGARGSRFSLRVTNVMSLAGLALVLAPLPFTYSARWFPGVGALPSVLGTVALLMTGRCAPAGVVNRVLARPALVFVGKRSYSWYLLHWPLLVFVRTVTFTESLPRDIVLGLLALAGAHVLHRCLEQPWREGRSRFTRSTLRSLLAGVAIIGALGGSGALVLQNTATASMLGLTASQAAALAENRRAWDICPDRASSVDLVDCSFQPDVPTRLVLIGDSHAFGLIPALQVAANDLGWGLDVLWSPACPFIVGYQAPKGDPRLSTSCTRGNQAAADYLRLNAASIGGLVTTSRASTYIGQASQPARALWSARLGETLNAVTSKGVPVVLLHDVPRFERPVAPCVIRKGPTFCSLDSEAARRTRQPVVAAENEAVRHTSGAVSTWDLFTALCDDRWCHPTAGDIVLFRDRSHLSKAGAMFVANQLVPWLVSTLQR